MSSILISMHIPKTGGTTFGRILEKIYGDKLRIDHPWQEDSNSIVSDLKSGKIIHDVRCIHGHFKLQKYEFLRSQKNVTVKYVTWLRDPVERAVSGYYYLRDKAPPERLDDMEPWEYMAKKI